MLQMCVEAAHETNGTAAISTRRMAREDCGVRAIRTLKSTSCYMIGAAFRLLALTRPCAVRWTFVPSIAMHYVAWRALCAFLSLMVLLQCFLLFTADGGGYDGPRHHRGRPVSLNHDPLPTTWAWASDRDAHNPGLNRAQCDAAFPRLYFEIDRSVSLWRDRNHTITQNDTEISWRHDAAFKALIHDNQLRILEMRHTWENDGYRQRTLSVLSQLHRALLGAAASGESVPDAEFAVTVDDMSLVPSVENDTHTIWAFTRRLVDRDQDRLWIVPDFNFWSAPPFAGSYAEAQRKARAHDAVMVMDKLPQVVWRGVKWTNEYVRGSLLDVTQGKSWADVKEVDWENGTNILKIEDICRYMFVTHTVSALEAAISLRASD